MKIYLMVMSNLNKTEHMNNDDISPTTGREITYLEWLAYCLEHNLIFGVISNLASGLLIPNKESINLNLSSRYS